MKKIGSIGIFFGTIFCVYALSLLYSCSKVYANNSYTLHSFISNESTESMIDTVFYTREGKGTKHKAFASYYRVFPNQNDPDFEPIFRDFYPSGEVLKEGFFLSIDKKDDSKTQFDGECITYYRKGNIKEGANYENGKKNGVYESFFENGILNIHTEYKDDLIDGVYEEYNENGNIKTQAQYKLGFLEGIKLEYDAWLATCKETIFSNGSPKYDYYVLSDSLGNKCKYYIADDAIVWEPVNESEKSTIVQNGEKWQFYNKNGLIIALRFHPVREHGKLYRVDLAIQNYSKIPFDFDPKMVDTQIRLNSGAHGRLQQLSQDDYISKVKRSYAWSSFLQALGTAVSSQAAYSVSTTKTETTISGSSSSVGAAVAVTSNGWGVGAFSGSSAYGGRVSSTSTTKTFDAAAAAQIQMANAYQNHLLQEDLRGEIKSIDEGYAKTTTIEPGRTYSGYLLFSKVKFDFITIIFSVNGIKYNFEWELEQNN